MRLGILKLGNENKLSFTTGSFCRNNHITAPTKPITAIMAKNIIKEEEKEQKQKELRKNGQGDFSNAK